MSDSHHIHISVTPQYIKAHSEPEKNRFAFTYTVEIENRGDVAAQLLTRHWIITDAEGHTEEVRGRGVVGEQPYLQPGERYRYTSGTLLSTPVGSMTGSYQMRDDHGQLFDAAIPAFTLAAEVTFH